MQKFHQTMLKECADLWKVILEHPFLTLTAENKIPDHTFRTWMQQDYLFVREAIPFMAVMLAKSPVQLRSNFIEIMVGLDKELELFRKNARDHGISLDNIYPAPTSHAYIQFLMNTAYRQTFEEGFTVLYTAEKIYLDSWMQVKNNLKGKSPWQEFIDNWTSEGFRQYVDWLAETLDQLVQDKAEGELEVIRDLFRTTARYEYLFWEMARTEEKWIA
jgi:thiaminase